MLTGHGSEESEVSCLQAGADDFVTKPVNTAVLRARIETQLRLRSMRRQLERQNDELEQWRRDLERDLAAARLTQQSLIPQKPLSAARLGSCNLLSPSDPGGRRYLRLAANEGWAEFCFGSQMAPVTAPRLHCLQLWQSFFFTMAMWNTARQPA